MTLLGKCATIMLVFTFCTVKFMSLLFFNRLHFGGKYETTIAHIISL